MWRDVMRVLSDSMASTAATQAELLARTAELASARSAPPHAPAPAAQPVAVQAAAQPAVSDELIMQMLMAASLRSQLETGASRMHHASCSRSAKPCVTSIAST